MDFEKEAREDFEILREVERQWLSDALTECFANLAYPVGMGVGPSKEHADIAASKLVDRYILILDRIRREAFSAGEESGREKAAQIVDAEDARVLGCQSGEKDPLKIGFYVDRHIRMTTVLLPNIAKAIRSIPLASTKKIGME